MQLFINRFGDWNCEKQALNISKYLTKTLIIANVRNSCSLIDWEGYNIDRT